MPNIVTTIEAFTEEVRRYLRDYPELNRLIKGEEHKDIDIAISMKDAAGDYNMTPPFIGDLQPNKIPTRYLTNFKLGTIIHLLQSVTLLNIRNRLTYNDGGVHVGIFDKQPDIQNWIGMIKPQYMKTLDRYKVSLNLEQAYGGVHSEYYIINNYYDVGEISLLGNTSNIGTGGGVE
ncbi:hypothetical protein LCGC14_0146890 [marine sediment metagenome]|uniref:Uncharacterized protein n=1 Tax=marine sediment metagenome TaxID=412755 RepID=A0A0F9VFK9_9ZZZZ